MSIKELKNLVQEIVCDYKFTSMKNNFYFRKDELGITINIQKSHYSNICYINYGFWVRELHNDEEYLTIEKCDIMGRFSMTRDDKIQYDFPLDKFNAEEVKIEIRRNINDKILPVMENGIEMYFRLYPQAIHTAKLNLKKYLEQS